MENIHRGHREKMRQRFLKSGLEGFADHEALELLLYYAIPRQDTNPIAHRLMDRYGSLTAVLSAPAEDLKKVEGIGESAAVLLKVAGQIGRKARLADAVQSCPMTDVETAGAMLGEPYCIDLPVRHGKRLGTALGFPTINQIYPDWMLLPRQGVYVTRVLLDGVWRPSATGLGTRPTVNGDGVTCETFIPDFSGDIYGDRVPVRFCRFLWPTQKFGTLEELSAMVGRAAQAAREWRDE